MGDMIGAGPVVRGAILAIGLCAASATAGPPYITDDPVPTDTGHWEIYAFSDNNALHGARDGQAGFDINYGLVKDVQFTTTLGGQYVSGDGRGLRLADTEIGLKYRFVHAGGLQIAVFPKLILPTAPGSSRFAYELPVWAQQDFGKWSLFGGGGVSLFSGLGARDAWSEDIAVTRQIGHALSFGIEAAHQGTEEAGEHGATTVQVGGSMHVAGLFSLIGAAGPVIEEHHGGTGVHAYAALLATF
jgi:hypothetical protein